MASLTDHGRRGSLLLMGVALLGGCRPPEPEAPQESATHTGTAPLLIEGGVQRCPSPEPLRYTRADVQAPGPLDHRFAGGGVAVADLNGDGHLDLLQPGPVGVELRLGPDYRPAPLPAHTLASPTGVSAADYDGDGDLDLFLSDYDGPDVLWQNVGGLFGGHV